MNEKMFELMEQMAQGIEDVKRDVAGLKTDVAGVKTDVAGVKTDVAGLKTDVADLKTTVFDMKTQLNCVDNRLAEVDSRTRKMELAIENDLSKQIQIIAEGHYDVSRSLEEYHAKAQELGAFKEIVELKLIILEKDVKELKEKVKLA